MYFFLLGEFEILDASEWKFLVLGSSADEDAAVDDDVDPANRFEVPHEDHLSPLFSRWQCDICQRFIDIGRVALHILSHANNNTWVILSFGTLAHAPKVLRTSISLLRKDHPQATFSNWWLPPRLLLSKFFRFNSPLLPSMSQQLLNDPFDVIE